ncbi:MULTISPECIES: hypothetical protein [Brachybacterium]|uniref:Uncharacterized protein n=1 Tax=Brachybacterium alimentarium TaxID=47845 RepID=A0A2A3YHZ6_9MICO|nr:MULTISPECIES: hypothetical protein [Brachybacterium]PCC32825.1 hypothetical protein CIK71_10745 [Brachybacterium alimentarium]PCC38914.1 hypothetical protein CIK66_11185 [Brachybacterium alimentarium]RCS64238.1 hypothetical protein CIK81_09115 [Brachybacterium sp. JB7]RCS68583.1 hypothetical protein CIK68_12880 [Brachybacterium alimentarium]RCS72036.1 hypothetical protein CIK73_02745 [Brachybacterium alimentarium]
MPASELLTGAGALLADPSPKDIIAPPQYSVAWVILAVLCLLVITALIVATLKITRAIEKRVAYRRRPTDVDTLKAEFLRAVNDIADRHDAGELEARPGHHELTAVMRRFVRRTTGHDVTSQDTGTLTADPRTRDVGELIAALYEPDFALSTDAELRDSVRRAREVIRRWS